MVCAEHAGVFSAASAQLVRRVTFAETFDPRGNAIGFLRMLFAVLVIVSHCFFLGGFGNDALAILTGQLSIAIVGVIGFFVLSGFLITRSALGAPSVWRFLWHRFLRLFPGYWFCLVICAFVFAPLFALQEHGVFWRVFWAPKDSPVSYVLGNAGMFHLDGFSIPGVMNLCPSNVAHLLRHNPHPWSINGSLWSLPYELACYLGVAGLTLAGALRQKRVAVLAVFCGLLALYEFSCLSPGQFSQLFPYTLFDTLVMLVLYFTAGSVCFLYRERIPCSTPLFVLCLVSLTLGLAFGCFPFVAPIALPYSILWLAFNLPVRNFDARGDFSYGIYLYAFPVQQGLALLHVQKHGYIPYLIASLLITSVFAVISYRWIEAPCLKWKNVDPFAVFQGRRGDQPRGALAQAQTSTEFGAFSATPNMGNVEKWCQRAGTRSEPVG
jgi:peptidoglycan/LPS O-acetylase OafA/YrhL